MTFTGLNLDDERWTRLMGGYRVLYDPREAMQRLEQGGDSSSAWQELWNELHHQGDIGDASFAAVPHLVRIHELRGVPDWNTYALAATIELARDNPNNPKLPAAFQMHYDSAWTRLVEIGLREMKNAGVAPLTVSILGVLAIGKGQRTLGRFAIELTEDERQEILSQIG